jgi:hypothetical protein
VYGQVLAPGNLLDGVSQKEWAARWCQWVMPMKVGFGPDLALTSSNPGVETTGAQGWKGNQTGSDQVFFLSGVFSNLAGTDTANRTVTVTQGKSLFFPFLNFFADNTASITDPLSTPTNFAADGMLTGDFGVDIIQSFDTASLFATIDGTSVANLKSFRQTFGETGFGVTYTGPDNIAVASGFDATLGTGVYPSTVMTAEDGYWMAVQPLSLGEHTLTFGGAVDFVDPGGNPLGFSASQNITYTVNVAVAAPEPGAFALAANGLFPLLGLCHIRRRRRENAVRSSPHRPGGRLRNEL